jgi:hypothetical protein
MSGESDEELSNLVETVIKRHIGRLDLVLEFDRELGAFAATLLDDKCVQRKKKKKKKRKKKGSKIPVWLNSPRAA